MRSHPPARRPICALAVLCSLVVPVAIVAAEGKKKVPVSECASFDQQDREDEDGVDLTVSSGCEVKLACSVKWTVTCAPDSKHPKRKKEAVTFDLENGQSQTASASVTACGLKGWEITDISWSCDPVE